ncbi:hypothetical protein L1987_30426 [Smallanthus sonchifolius]|uniref:Uncharacterized protein n=1 Tax=Smallanthus sonchifolius TaxID=185202 RepID=A0ACB9I3G7_9ASTR|nr:hypothetical protein L1987_30426 [Smallanthus sonchifolius]
MDCEGCERRVRKSVEGMKGVSSVEVDPKKSLLKVVGYVDPDKVLHRVRHRTGKKAEMWPYVPYDVVDHPYVPGVYDKKAPPGYVRKADPDPQTGSLARASSTEIRYTTAFSGTDHLMVHPRFLHSNATSNKWALGAFAELLDNSLDEANDDGEGGTFALYSLICRHAKNLVDSLFACTNWHVFPSQLTYVSD